MRRSLTILLAAISFMLMSATMILLEERSVLNGKVALSVPKGFTEMSQESLKKIYRMAQHPKLVYGNEDGSVRVAVTHTETKAAQKELSHHLADYRTAFNNNFRQLVWKGEGIKKINGRDVGYLGFIVEGGMKPVYNLMFFTDVDGRLALFTFSCSKELLPDWNEAAADIMASLKVK